MVKIWFGLIPKTKPKPLLREDKKLDPASVHKDRGSAIWTKPEPSHAGFSEIHNPMRHTHADVFHGKLPGLGGGEIFSTWLTPKFSSDAPWEVASLRTSGSRGKWRPESYPLGLTGKIMGSELALCIPFPASNTWMDWAVVCVRAHFIKNKKNPTRV